MGFKLFKSVLTFPEYLISCDIVVIFCPTLVSCCENDVLHQSILRLEWSLSHIKLLMAVEFTCVCVCVIGLSTVEILPTMDFQRINPGSAPLLSSMVGLLDSD